MPRLASPSLVVALAGLLTACPRPPTSTPPPDVDDTRETIALETFVQDRPAIGGKWYDYSVDGHILQPKGEAWLLRRGEAQHAFTITSVYDDNTGDSGQFHLAIAHRTGNVWSAPAPFVATTNVKDTDSSVCVDVGDAASSAVEVDCASDAWELRFAEQSRLSVFAGFAVKEPAVFLADDVVVARVDVVRADDGSVDFAALPDPSTRSALVESDAAFDSTDWDFAAYAPDLPQNGQALGRLSRIAGQRFAMVDGGRGFVEFSVAAVDDDTLRFSLRRTEIDFETFTVPKERAAFVDIDIDVDADPASPTFVSFQEADAKTPADALEGVAWPLALPSSRVYDVMVFADDAEPRLVLSPATALAVLPASEP
jgi:hypothetical protein